MRSFYFWGLLLLLLFLACYFFDYPNKPPFMQSTISILRWPKQTTNQLIHQPKGPSKQNGQAFCIAEVTVKQDSLLQFQFPHLLMAKSYTQCTPNPTRGSSTNGEPQPLTRILCTCNTETTSRAHSSKFLKHIKQYICFSLLCKPITAKQRQV